MPKPETATIADPDVGPVMRRGLLMVLSSPSGAGKTTISKALLSAEPDMKVSVSVTTRPMRPGEVDGVDYHFVSVDRFKEMAASGQLLEHAQVFDNHYGTPRGPVEDMLSNGKDVLFDIDWQGHRQLGETASADLVSIFILPPSWDELHRRLSGRKQDSEEVIAGRMAKAASEMSHWHEYDFVVVNDVVTESVSQIRTILHAERMRRVRQMGLESFMRTLRVDPVAES